MKHNRKKFKEQDYINSYHKKTEVKGTHLAYTCLNLNKHMPTLMNRDQNRQARQIM